MQHWKYKQSIGIGLLNKSRICSVTLSESQVLNSDLPTDLMSDITAANTNVLLKSIQDEHKKDKILQKRRKCMWIKDDGKRCDNGTLNCCRACLKDGEPLLLCGSNESGHLKEHHALQMNAILNQINN